MSIYEYDEKKHLQFEREEGYEEGMEEGDTRRIIILGQKKIAKGKTLDVIADELESSVEEIQPIYDVAVKYPTDTDPKIIFMNMQKED